MKRSTVLVLASAAVLVLGGAILGVAAVQSGPASVSSTVAPTPIRGTGEPAPSSAAPDDPSPSSEARDSVPAGAYVDYADDAVAAATGTRILFFHADWCPQCRALEEDILAQGVPPGVTIFKVDYDTNQELRQRHGVRLQTTVVLLDAAEESAASMVPYDDPTLARVLAGLGVG
ncbi:MAG: thioredoxin [Microbacterium sp.]|uniref:thioredoxin family protein n=1 Tax=Microbacterium sp. TaxID=51671 RepID=UPI000DB2496C|nr:thioredoxin family protein [Microbacterium sp.]PZU40071.1 MAG: thioredoxin [Microbacterium sp.]